MTTIKSIYGAALYTGTSGMSMRAALEAAKASGADLSRADLSGADLSGANLTTADLSGADLSGADLSGADLSRVDLSGADLSRVDLSGADLSGADLSGADLSGAYMRGAYLSGADLSRAKGLDALTIARTRILPDVGSLVGWKKCRNNVIVKLVIPDLAKRSHAFGRKCRAEFVDVLEVIGATTGISQHDGHTAYAKGQRVICDKWNANWQEECAGGIHFYITRAEAEDH